MKPRAAQQGRCQLWRKVHFFFPTWGMTLLVHHACACLHYLGQIHTSLISFVLSYKTQLSAFSFGILLFPSLENCKRLTHGHDKKEAARDGRANEYLGFLLGFILLQLQRRYDANLISGGVWCNFWQRPSSLDRSFLLWKRQRRRRGLSVLKAVAGVAAAEDFAKLWPWSATHFWCRTSSSQPRL